MKIEKLWIVGRNKDRKIPPKKQNYIIVKIKKIINITKKYIIKLYD